MLELMQAAVAQTRCQSLPCVVSLALLGCAAQGVALPQVSWQARGEHWPIAMPQQPFLPSALWKGWVVLFWAVYQHWFQAGREGSAKGV